MTFIKKALTRHQDEAPEMPASSPAAVPSAVEKRSPATEPSFQISGDTLTLSTLRLKKALDFAALRASGMLPAEHERRLFSQVYRAIKRPLLNRAAQRSSDNPEFHNANVVMVASGVPGEGKTFTAVNLALSLALERDRQVVLIDGDVVKRDLSQRLGFNDEPGLMDALKDGSERIEHYLFQTDVPNLAILPAGSTSMHATEMLSSARMRELVGQLASIRECMVIFDTSPLLLTTECRAIAEVAGQVVLVVREGETPQDVVLDSTRLLQGCPSVSLILNQSMAPPRSGYGYGYGERIASESAAATAA